MALKTTLFFLTLLLFVVLSSLLIDTSGDIKNKTVELPTIEFKDFKIYNITTSGVIESLVAKIGLHYENKDLLYDGLIFRGSEGNIEGIKGKNILINSQNIIVNGQGEFFSPQGYKINAEKIIYDIKKKYITTAGNFQITQNPHTLSGQNLWIDLNTKKMGGENINAKIFLHRNSN